MARPAKSQALHDLQNTELRSNLAVSNVPGALPRPDKSLSKDAKKKFRSLARQLHDVRQAVTAGDADLLALYCSAWERLQQANLNIRVEGLIVEYTRLDKEGNPHSVFRPNISLKIAEVAERTCLSYLARLGLTPKDRELVKPTSPQPTGREKTVAEKLDEEIAALEQQENTAESTVDEDLLTDIDETVVEVLTPQQKLMAEADRALAVENSK